MAFARDEDEAVEILEEICVPVRIVVQLDWVPEIGDSVYPLANLEWIGGSTSCETAIVDSKLSKD